MEALNIKRKLLPLLSLDNGHAVVVSLPEYHNIICEGRNIVNSNGSIRCNTNYRLEKVYKNSL